MQLTYCQPRGRYELEFVDIQEYQRSNGLPRRLNFTYDGKRRLWWTVSPEAAASLINYADESTRERLQQTYNRGLDFEPQMYYRHNLYWLRIPYNLETKARLLTFKKDSKQGLWFTPDPFYALKFIKHAADDETRQPLLEFKRELRRREKLSRALDADIEIPVPDGLSYYGYQRAGIAYAASVPASLNGDDMGVGKTIQAIGLVNYLGDQVRDILIVCPASLKFNWRNECRRWLVDKATELHIASARWWPKPNVFVGMVRRIIIINYDVLDRIEQHTGAQVWDLIVADECHKIKNPSANRTKAFKEIKARRKLLMSGTPILNRPSELYSILHYLDPVRYFDKAAFLDRYCEGNAKGAQHLDELQKRLRGTLMIRRMKREVLTELPPKMRQVVVLEDTTGAVDRERAALAQLGIKLGDATDDAQAFADQVQKIHKTKPGALGEISRIRHETALSKVPQVIDQVKAGLEQRAKVGVIAHHKDVVRKIADAFPEDEVVTYTGDMSLVDREAVVDRVQNDPTAKVFIGTYGAAGVGITLTAISYVVMAEQDWVPGNISQAEDRFCRIGQTDDNVHVIHLVLDGSLDAYMIHILIEKQEIIESALDKRSDLNTTTLQETDDDQKNDDHGTGSECVTAAAQR